MGMLKNAKMYKKGERNYILDKKSIKNNNKDNNIP